MPTEARRVSNAEMRQYDDIVRIAARAFTRRLPAQYDRDDIIAAARIGLFRALSHAENRDEEFRRYAFARVKGAIRDELRAQDWMKRYARQRGVVATIVPIDDEDHLASDAWERKLADRIALREVEAAIQLLPPREARIILDFYVHEVDVYAIGAQMGISAVRVSQLKLRGLNRLAEILGGAPQSDRVKPRPKRRTKSAASQDHERAGCQQ